MRRRKATEDVWYDIFAEWSAEDQAAAIKTLGVIQRQTARREAAGKTAAQRLGAGGAGLFGGDGSPAQFGTEFEAMGRTEGKQ